MLGTGKALRGAPTAHSVRPSGLDGACAQLADWQLRDGRQSEGTKWASVFQMRSSVRSRCVARRQPTRVISIGRLNGPAHRTSKSNHQSGIRPDTRRQLGVKLHTEPTGIPLAVSQAAALGRHSGRPTTISPHRRGHSWVPARHVRGSNLLRPLTRTAGTVERASVSSFGRVYNCPPGRSR